ncbi:hypothetical protein LTR36_010515 [Oleoguttula mirabilis]|uniref:F-box domain-containing protein n=1 Tax=Oleoguttula mirabilis TaxID=1507867 RepID=A0AAV9J5I0_9PEZI|nr:hypothetical protein LTR36_010515 [Oleoguttula mirabilis]
MPEPIFARTPFIQRTWTLSDMNMKALKGLMRHRNLTTRGLRHKDDAIARLEKVDMQAKVYNGIGKARLQSMIRERAAKWCDCKGKCTEPEVTLEIADRQRTFHAFLKLPPELRNLVYEHMFDDIAPLAEGLLRPKQPSITRVCRQVRQESLGLFYATQTFVLEIADGRRETSSNAVAACELAQVDARWLRTLGGGNVANIRSVMIISHEKSALYAVTKIRVRNDPFTASVIYVKRFCYNPKEYGGVEWKAQVVGPPLWGVQASVGACIVGRSAAVDIDYLRRIAEAATHALLRRD